MKSLRLHSKVRKALRGSSAGFTLIEVLVALALFSIIAIVFAGGLGTASRAVFIADVRTNAESLARTQMEYVKNQDYYPAPQGGVANYTKIADIPAGYSVWSANRDGDPVNGGATDDVIGIPWDSGNNTDVNVDNELQKITLVIKHEGSVVTTLECYKVDR
ncbi:MAG: type II secretion system protein [Dehalococcoidia bacterium]|nr:type II secretion system protein [Dehalococcoidia bacterium]